MRLAFHHSREAVMAKRYAVVTGSMLAALLAATDSGAGGASGPQFVVFPNATGFSATLSASGPMDLTNPFFQKLGTNGRSCDTCHVAGEGWTIKPSSVQARFDATGGTDPIFRTNDGAVSPNADVTSVEARRKAYGMLLSK